MDPKREAKNKKRDERRDDFLGGTEMFVNWSLHYIEKLPPSFEHTHVKPMVKVIYKIYSLVRRANRVYINNSLSHDELKAAYADRIRLLTKSLRRFSEFDGLMQILVNRLRVETDSMEGLRRTMSTMAAVARETENHTVHIEYHIPEELFFTAGNNSTRVRLRLTVANRDNWTRLKLIAEDRVQYRITRDRSILKNMKEKNDMKT